MDVRYCLITILLIATSAQGLSKDEPDIRYNARHGFHSGFFFYKGSLGPIYFSGPSIEKRYHYVSVSPTFGPQLNVLPDRVSKQQPKKYTLTGTMISYQFRPHSNDRFFEMSFNYDFLLNFHKDEGRDLGNMNDRYQSKRLFAANFVGFGLNLKFLKHFYFHNNIGVGIGANKVSVDYEEEKDSEVLHYEPKFIFRTGLGIRLK